MHQARRRRRVALIFTAVLAATVGLSVTPVGIAFADHDYAHATDTSSNLWGYWQDCQSSEGPCPTFDIQYDYYGGFGIDTYKWYQDGKMYADLEGRTDNGGYFIATGDAIGGQCCPDVQIDISPAVSAEECHHSRSTCGHSYTAYTSATDKNNAQGYGVTCSQNDYCVGLEYNDEQTMFQDGFWMVGACEVPVGDAMPQGGECAQYGWQTDFGE